MTTRISLILALATFSQVAHAIPSIIQPQGRKLQGAAEEPSYVMWSPADLKAGKDYGGENSVAGKKLIFRVIASFPHGDTLEYEVKVRDRSATDADLRALCTGSSNRALAVQGRWDAKGNHTDDPNQFTFACTDGLIAKCIDWGWRPDKTVPRTTDKPLRRPFITVARDSVSLFPYHQACTRMGRADYCGNNSSNTVEGTKVYAYDNIEYVQYADTPEIADFYLEGGWTTGATCCLSKKRWATLALGGPCSVELPDPRMIQGVKFCEDLLPGKPKVGLFGNAGGSLNNDKTVGAAGGQGLCAPIIGNYSKFIDAGLWLWRNKNNDALTTSEGYWTGVQRKVEDMPVGQSFYLDAKTVTAAFEGTVYDGAGAQPDGTIPLFVYQRKDQPTKFWTTTCSLASMKAAPKPSCNLTGYVAYEWVHKPTGIKNNIAGYVLPSLDKIPADQQKRYPKLVSYVNRSGEHLTTAMAPAKLPPGYDQTNPRVEGYLLAMP